MNDLRPAGAPAEAPRGESEEGASTRPGDRPSTGAELRSVVAHEMAHIVRRHVLDRDGVGGAHQAPLIAIE